MACVSSLKQRHYPSQTRRSLFCPSFMSHRNPFRSLIYFCPFAALSSWWLSIMEGLRNSSTNSSTNSVHAFRRVLLFRLAFLSFFFFFFFFTNCWKWWSQQSNIAMPAAKAIEILPTSHLVNTYFISLVTFNSQGKKSQWYYIAYSAEFWAFLESAGFRIMKIKKLIWFVCGFLQWSSLSAFF